MTIGQDPRRRHLLSLIGAAAATRFYAKPEASAATLYGASTVVGDSVFTANEACVLWVVRADRVAAGQTITIYDGTSATKAFVVSSAGAQGQLIGPLYLPNGFSVDMSAIGNCQVVYEIVPVRGS